MMRSQPNKFLKPLTNFWSYWVKPPKLLKRYVTVRDIQKQAGLIGGKQFSKVEDAEQVFFWMPDSQSTPKIGEYIYMRYIPDASGNVEKILSHIHYPVSRRQDGEFEVNKYYASTDAATTVSYKHQPVDKEELQDLLTAARQLRTRLSQEWGPVTA